MCFVLPVKIISVKDKKIIIEEAGRRRQTSGSLIRVKPGDYAILENNFIVKKVGKKSAEEIINLIKKSI